MHDILPARQELLEYIVENSTRPIFLCSGDELKLEFANKAAHAIWNTVPTALGTPIAGLMPALKSRHHSLLQSVLTTGNPVSFELSIARLTDQSVRHYHFTFENVTGFLISGTGILCTATDVTALINAKEVVEESEKQFRQIADAVPQIVWVTDPSGSHEYFNQQWYDYTQSNFDESKGSGWAKFVHPDDVEQSWVVWNHSLATGETYDYEYRIRNGITGMYRWFLGRAVPIFDEQGKIIRWFGTCTDVEAQKQLLQQKDDFIGIASHELKTPLASLKAVLQLMARLPVPDLDHRLKMLINQGNTSVNKLTTLVDSLLNVTKLNQTKIELNREEFRVAAMVSSCCTHVNLEGKHEIVVTGDRDVTVFADHHRIEQVIVNLVNNAIKYAPESKNIYINISKEGDYVKVSVTDCGPGIAPEKLPHLFERYYRADENGGQISGLGLGLYIANVIISKHHGTMGVESTPGKGSTFWFTLPIGK